MIIKSRQKGFTLVEMIISIGLFTVVVVVATGALLKVIDSNKKSQSLKTVVNNINFALESISREMRVGSQYNCVSVTTINPQIPLKSSQGCLNGYGNNPNNQPWTIYFNSSKISTINGGGTCSLIYAYQYDGNTLNKAQQTDCNSNTFNFYPLISSDIKFDRSYVKVFAQSGRQSYAQFHFRGYTGLKEKNKTYFNVQTTVSQRLAD